MIDVWIRTTRLLDPLRKAFFDATYERWHLEPGVKVSLLRDRGIREGRMLAEEWSQSSPYIYTDDDVLIVGKDWIKRGLEAIGRVAHEQYACLSSLSLVEGENLARGSGDVYEMHAVGAPMWIRKGILKDDLPELSLDQECGIIHKYVLDKGFKEGLINGLRHNHLGHGFSSNPALHWGY